MDEAADAYTGRIHEIWYEEESERLAEFMAPQRDGLVWPNRQGGQVEMMVEPADPKTVVLWVHTIRGSQQNLLANLPEATWEMVKRTRQKVGDEVDETLLFAEYERRPTEYCKARQSSESNASQVHGCLIEQRLQLASTGDMTKTPMPHENVPEEQPWLLCEGAEWCGGAAARPVLVQTR